MTQIWPLGLDWNSPRLTVFSLGGIMPCSTCLNLFIFPTARSALAELSHLHSRLFPVPKAPPAWTSIFASACLCFLTSVTTRRSSQAYHQRLLSSHQTLCLAEGVLDLALEKIFESQCFNQAPVKTFRQM